MRVDEHTTTTSSETLAAVDVRGRHRPGRDQRSLGSDRDATSGTSGRRQSDVPGLETTHPTKLRSEALE